MPVEQMTQFVALAQVTHNSLAKTTAVVASAESRKALSDCVRTKQHWLFNKLC